MTLTDDGLLRNVRGMGAGHDSFAPVLCEIVSMPRDAIDAIGNCN